MPDPTAISTSQFVGEKTSVLRILDANVNRATEGLRVLEEYVRFVLDDAHLSRLCKELRHDTAGALQRIAGSERWAARDTLHDVGTQIFAPTEYLRENLADVLTANASRIEQSLRCLEEYAKLLSPGLAPLFEAFRYRAYTLARAIIITGQSCQRLSHARLYVLVDGGSSAESFGLLIRRLTVAGTHVIQLRDKQLCDRVLVERARLLRTLTRRTNTLFIMNDRPDLALLADADGVHVGQAELTVKDARTLIGPQRLVGVSTHSLDQARQAVLDGANYIGCGPTFPSGTKTFASFPGTEFLQQVRQELSLPAFAIGGISRDNVEQVLAAGFTRIAVSGAVVDAADPGQAASWLLGKLPASVASGRD
ncbi:MAG: thiamine phosphate synthase [Planctomycetota bacterium]|nr:thiamine phosphate synthase [Planctomycetota bacterium]